MKKRVLLAAVFCAAAAAQAAEVKIGGLIFAQYEYVVSDHLADGTTSYDQNSFDVGRVYFNADAKFDDRVKGFLQYEVNLVTREGTTNSVFLKQAFIEIKDVYPDAKVMVGLVPSLWRGYEEGIWKHRFVAKLLDDFEGINTATDRGARISGKLSYLDYDLAVANGEGVKANEVKASKYKDFTAKAAVAPFKEGPLAGLQINCYGQSGNYGRGLARDRVFSGLSYESKRFNAMGTFFSLKDQKTAASSLDKGRGVSFHGFYNLPKTWWVFGRYDRWDPNKEKDDDARSRVITGIGREITQGVRAALDYQTLTRQKETASAKDESLASLHFELKF